MANCAPDFRYRVYMSGILVIAERLRRLNSIADFVIIVTFKPGLDALPASDLALLADRGVIIRYGRNIWQRFLEQDKEAIPDPERAAEKSVMYNKLFAWEMTEYAAVQYLDADCMPTGQKRVISNSTSSTGSASLPMMDRYFVELPRTTFIRGWMSPLQGGWYLLKPSLETFAELVDLVKHRYSSSWEPNQGWDVRNERPAGKGPCLDDDQGLFWCYFRYAQRAPPMTYVDHRNTRVARVEHVSGGRVVSHYSGKNFTFLWEHFGGRFKPWRVCSSSELQRNLPTIAAKHSSHWPPSKLKSFRVYCDVFRDLQLRHFVNEFVQPMKAQQGKARNVKGVA
jgi:hypothetical protein